MWSSAHVRRWFWSFNSTTYTTCMPTFPQRWACLVLCTVAIDNKRNTILLRWKGWFSRRFSIIRKPSMYQELESKRHHFPQQFHWICSAISLNLLCNFIEFTLQFHWIYSANTLNLLKKVISARCIDGIAGQSMQRLPLYHTTYMNVIRTAWKNKAQDMHYCFKPFLSCFKWMVT